MNAGGIRKLERASALPRKRFFIDMFTRDISLGDCVLDLVYNSIDGLVRTRELDIADALRPEPSKPPSKHALPEVRIVASERSFTITDNCGGMSYHFAKNEAFNFGHPPDYHENGSYSGTLGVYGVGLKRAIFKIGDYFEIESHPASEPGFVTKVESLRDWVERDSDLSDWSFPIEAVAQAQTARQAGTKLTIRNLRDEVSPLITDSGFLSSLHTEIARVFALFLEQHVRVRINKQVVEPVPVPFGQSEEVTPAFKELTLDGVKVDLYASLARRGSRNEWIGEQAGWYVACNGRLVVVANKDGLTGWGSSALPSYHSKYRGFVGLAHFVSSDPYLLPWTTTKRGLNQESLAYQRVRNEMRAISRPVISFLDRMYSGDIAESKPEREIADAVVQADLTAIAKRQESPFTVTPRTRRKAKTTTKVQYDAEIADVERIRKHLRDPQLSASKIGLITFEDYLSRIDQ
jgi:hypothetical protein